MPACLRLFCCLLGRVSPMAAVLAQPAAAVLGPEVSEQALIEALAPAPASAASGATRGFAPPVRRASRPAAAGARAGVSGAAGRADLMITFTTGSEELSEESKEVLRKLAAALNSPRLSGLDFAVQGHADARGDAQSNQALSEHRAQAVLQYLVGPLSVAGSRLTAEGKGAAEPLRRDRVDAPENRRVTIVTQPR